MKKVVFILIFLIIIKILIELYFYNSISIDNSKQYKIAIITTEDRQNLNFVKLHNRNISDYCKKWNYEYHIKITCKLPVYWCKMEHVLQLLETNKYDYVMWMDSDTIINDFDTSLNSVIKYCNEKDIIIGTDDTILSVKDLVYRKQNNNKNAGVFLIKNSEIGKSFLQNCLNTLTNKCIKKNGKLKGKWASYPCYEQGVMNHLINTNPIYHDSTFQLTKNILVNSNLCRKNTFITHYYRANEKDREKCFS